MLAAGLSFMKPMYAVHFVGLSSGFEHAQQWFFGSSIQFTEGGKL